MKIHIYAQHFSHQDAYIVADAEGLAALSAACDQARKTTTAIGAFTEDGEGYAVFVTSLEERDPKWEQLSFPYTDKEITGKGGDLSPFDLIGSDKYKELHAKMRGDTRGK
jgi:hypothetical protein